MQVSFCLKSEDECPVEIGLLNPSDELRRRVDYWNKHSSYILWYCLTLLASRCHDMDEDSNWCLNGAPVWQGLRFVADDSE